MPNHEKDFPEKKKKKKKSFLSKKNFLFTIIIVILIVFPALWAFANARITDNQGFFGTQFEISLYDTQGNLITTDSSLAEYSSSSSVVSMFHQILTNMQPSTEQVDLSYFNLPINAIIKQNQVEEKYTFYFSDSSTCYCTATSGQVYSISQEDANVFLSSTYSEAVYPTAIPPILITANNEHIIPKSVEWYYQNQSGAFIRATTSTITTQNILYEIPGSLDIRFAEQPDVCTINIYSNNALIFKGKLDEISEFSIQPGKKLNVQITAEWNLNESSKKYGKLTYSFDVSISNYADFTLNSTQVEKDGFVILSGTNIDNIDNIELIPFASDESLIYPYSTVFYDVGAEAKALIIFPSELAPGEYRFRVNYAAFSKEFCIELVSSNANTTIYNSQKSFEDIYSLTNSKAKESFLSISSDVFLKVSSDIYCSDIFLNPTSFGYQCEYTYDTPISCDDKSLIFNAIGNRYHNTDAKQTAVPALNSGKVIFIGNCSYLGNFVVVDHGFGMLTWYCNLSYIRVNEGDYVAIGEELGRSGTHGTSIYDGFLLLCSINDKFLNPSYCFPINETES